VTRTLTVSRARVDPGVEREYIEAVGALARVAGERGRRLWLFRSPARPGWFLECSESGSAEAHRVVANLGSEEARLERRVRELATYEDGAWERWEEVRLEHAAAGH
jgi:hypothetical protein